MVSDYQINSYGVLDGSGQSSNGIPSKSARKRKKKSPGSTKSAGLMPSLSSMPFSKTCGDEAELQSTDDVGLFRSSSDFVSSDMQHAHTVSVDVSSDTQHVRTVSVDKARPRSQEEHEHIPSRLRPQSAVTDSADSATSTATQQHWLLSRPILHTSSGPPKHSVNRTDKDSKPVVAFTTPSTVSEEPLQPFAAYLSAELNPGPSFPTTDVVWGQTERDRVYNALVYVPYQLERLIAYGMLICFDAFLAIFTVLPFRVLRAVWDALPWRREGGGRRPPAPALQGNHVLFDVICIMIYAVTVLTLRQLNAGAIYFWMKDLTQEFLKLQVIYTAVELFDKIFCSFAVDTLEALAGTCTLFMSGRGGNRDRFWHVLTDALVALTIVNLHGAIIMCHGMVFSVAMNSKRSTTLVGLLIAANFVEIKSTVMKKFDPARIFTLTCQDLVERFHICIALLFVLVEEMDNSGRWWPNTGLAWQCGQIFAAEVIIDVIKHAVLGKFNEIRPGVYREFMKDVCEKMTQSQSHNEHRIVSFDAYAPAALFLRIVLTFLVIRSESMTWAVLATRVALFGCGWLLLCCMKLVLGYVLKVIAYAYVQHYEYRYSKAGRMSSRGLRTSTPPPRSAVVSKME